MNFYRICNSSCHFLTAKPATLSCTMHILLSVLSCSQVETTVQIFAHVGVEPYATFKVWKTKLFLTMPTPRLTFGKRPTVGRRSEKCPTNKWAGIDQAITICLRAWLHEPGWLCLPRWLSARYNMSPVSGAGPVCRDDFSPDFRTNDSSMNGFYYFIPVMWWLIFCTYAAGWFTLSLHSI